MKKYYAVRDSSLRALFSGKRVRYVKANEELNFSAREGETVAIVGDRHRR
jgi:peptide/nickel transport system ATP-binding protein